MQHAHEIPLSVFGPLRDGQTSIGYQMVWRQGVAGAAPLPVELMAPGLRRRAPLVLIKFSLISGK